MRILIITTSDLESPSTLGRYFPLARELANLGHQVTFASLHGNYASLSEKQFSKDGVYIIYAGQMQVLKIDNQKIYLPWYHFFVNMLLSTLKLTWIALRTPVDIIHLGKPHPMNSIAVLAAKILNRKLLFGDFDDYELASGHFNNQLQKRIVQFFEDKMPHWVDHITTHNHFLIQRMIHLGVPEHKITYLPNGVDFERFKNIAPSKIEELRQKLGLEDQKVIAFIGSLSAPSHPVDLLLEAFEIVHQKEPSAKLLIIGGGEEYERLKEKARQSSYAQNILFAGRIAPQEVVNYYQLVNVLVDPALEDDAGRSRLPVKLFESWVSGVPFVTCDVGDRKIILGDPPAGLLANPGDPESLAAKILDVLGNPKLANQLIHNGYSRSVDYDWKNLAQKLERVYKEQLSKPKH